MAGAAAPRLRSLLVLVVLCAILGNLITISFSQDPSQLTLDYYSKTCPSAQEIIRTEMECAVHSDPHLAAAILHLHFHDCFVQGCDGSVLLDDTYGLKGEKDGSQINADSLLGFDLVDRIKNQLESECPGVVSCADLLTVAARDAVVLVGGPYWHVPLGRKDAKTASLEEAEAAIPTASNDLLTLISKFVDKGLSVTDMVALAGAHTIGTARCKNFRSRIYNGDFKLTSASTSDSDAYLQKLKNTCPAADGDDNTAPLDPTSPYVFDNSYFIRLQSGEGLLNSDQVLYSNILPFLGSKTKGLVEKYAVDGPAFFQQFADSMVKLGNITNPAEGEVRTQCRFINSKRPAATI